MAVACCLLSVAQRRLSTPARELRRRTAEYRHPALTTGETCPLDAETVAEPLEGALQALWLGAGAAGGRRVAARLGAAL